MIIWLASYPKSGNTLLRSILSTYFYSEDGVLQFENLTLTRDLETNQGLYLTILQELEMISNY